MSIIKCEECGNEISDKAKKCPNCGCPTNSDKSFTRLIVLIIATICGIIGLTVCFSGAVDFIFADKTKETDNTIIDNYYAGAIDYHSYVIKFNNDNTVIFVDCGLGREIDNRFKSYGTYSIDENAMYINMSGGDSFTCVIHENAESITIDGKKFTLTNFDELSKKTKDCFNK